MWSGSGGAGSVVVVGTHVVNLKKGFSGLDWSTCNKSFDSQQLSAVTTVCATTTPHARVLSLQVHEGCIQPRTVSTKGWCTEGAPPHHAVQLAAMELRKCRCTMVDAPGKSHSTQHHNRQRTVAWLLAAARRLSACGKEEGMQRQHSHQHTNTSAALSSLLLRRPI